MGCFFQNQFLTLIFVSAAASVFIISVALNNVCEHCVCVCVSVQYVCFLHVRVCVRAVCVFFACVCVRACVCMRDASVWKLKCQRLLIISVYQALKHTHTHGRLVFR